MNLTDRINDRRQPNPTITPLVERRGGTERRIPAWIKCMQDGQLPAKELTGRAA